MSQLSGLFLALAIASILAALFFILRGLRLRGRMSRYGVGRQENRRGMLRAMLVGVIALLGGLGFWLAYGITVQNAGIVEATPLPTLTVTPSLVLPTSTPKTEIGTATQLPTPNIMATSLPSATPTTPLDIPTNTPSPTFTPSATPKPPTAIVNSPNGLYLRDVPAGIAELEIIPHGAELILLDGRETIDELEWQKVRTNAGNEGWVALSFLVLDQ